MVVGRIKWCGSMVCALANALCFLACFGRERESVLNTCFERGRTDVSNDTEPMVCTPKKCFPNKRTSSQFFARDVKMMMYVSSAPCILRYEIFFSNDTTLPVVETSTEKGLERSFSYLAVPSVSYISISVVRFSFPPHPPTETCFSEGVAVEDRPNKETPLLNRGVSSNSDY